MTEIKDLKELDVIELTGTKVKGEPFCQKFIVDKVSGENAAVVLSKRRKSKYRLIGDTLMKTWDNRPRRIASDLTIEVLGKAKGRGRPKKEEPQMEEEMMERICSALNGVWDEIGGDMLQCIEDCGEAKKGRASMPRLHVMEVCADAAWSRVKEFDEEAHDALREYAKHGDAMWKKIAKRAFPYKTYGW